MIQFKRPDRQNLLMFLLVLVTVSAVCAAVWSVFFRTEDTVLVPDRVPAAEQRAQPIPGDTGTHEDAEPGSGSVSMTYSDRVKICLEDGSAELLLANPGRSNQDMMLQLVIQDRVLFQSGSIAPGNRLTQIHISPEEAAMLMPGGYDGQFRLYFYDCASGKKAVITTEIPVSVTVTE